MNNPLEALIDGKRIISVTIQENTDLQKHRSDLLADYIISKLLEKEIYLVANSTTKEPG